MVHFPHKPLKDKIKQLSVKSSKNPIVPLNATDYSDYVEAPEKNYSFIVLFIRPMADDHYDVRRQIYDEMLAIANYYVSSAFKSKIFFGVVDIEREPLVFEAVKVRYLRDTGTLITKTTPMIMHYPSADYLTPSDYIDLEHMEIDNIGDMILSKIKTKVGPQQDTPRPDTGDLAILYVCYHYLWFLHDKEFWAYISVGLCIVYLSGEVWTHIAGAGLVVVVDGKINVILDGEEQTMLETYIVMFLITGSVCGMILVIESMDSTHEDKEGKSMSIRRNIYFLGTQAVLGTALTCLFFTILASLCRQKHTILAKDVIE